MPRIRTVDLMLAGTVVLWALNVTLSKYILTHGLRPLAYSSLRYSSAALIFAGMSLAREGAVRLTGRTAVLLWATSVALLTTNQFSFVYSLRFTTASTVALIFGVTPIATALIAVAFGMERLSRRFAIASVVSLAGVALVALGGAGGGVSTSLKGNLLGVWTAVSWGAYSVAIAALMRVWSPIRISAAVLLPTALLLTASAVPQLRAQDFHAVAPWVWVVFAIAVLGPLVLTNLLWFTAVERVGPSHATLFNNLQPFLAVLLAVVLLSERLSLVQVLGGVAIAIGVGLAWRRQALPVPAE